MKDIIICCFVLWGCCYPPGFFLNDGEIAGLSLTHHRDLGKQNRGRTESVFILPSNAADKKSGRHSQTPSSAGNEEDDELTTSKRYQPAIQDLVVLALILAIGYLNCFFSLRYFTFRFLKATPYKQYILLRVIRL